MKIRTDCNFMLTGSDRWDRLGFLISAHPYIHSILSPSLSNLADCWILGSYAFTPRSRPRSNKYTILSSSAVFVRIQRIPELAPAGTSTANSTIHLVPNFHFHQNFKLFPPNLINHNRIFLSFIFVILFITFIQQISGQENYHRSFIVSTKNGQSYQSSWTWWTWGLLLLCFLLL